MKLLAEGMKGLSKNLKNFILNLEDNRLVGNSENIRWLRDILKWLAGIRNEIAAQ